LGWLEKGFGLRFWVGVRVVIGVEVGWLVGWLGLGLMRVRVKIGKRAIGERWLVRVGKGEN